MPFVMGEEHDYLLSWYWVNTTIMHSPVTGRISQLRVYFLLDEYHNDGNQLVPGEDIIMVVKVAPVITYTLYMFGAL